MRAAERSDLLEALVEGKQRFAVAYEEPHARYEPAAVLISNGLQPGEVVVTAGVQSLHPGQKVRVLGAVS
mgnify:CR=1 FL=1